nr:MAG TPA: hypothetical protein [Caudoviricetes sp.]
MLHIHNNTGNARKHNIVRKMFVFSTLHNVTPENLYIFSRCCACRKSSSRFVENANSNLQTFVL